ncbi:tail protein X [Endozoicomonas gorgoniicola]|uniref:Tail protein X n=1 Tax=Endozoicomonas gorgoniicola TaxID=1234144 RepID=A0ABT3MW89_9GAMM|nr:tail protein X [Endozoicomonas gorgoniicola]MCW7553640.1 tail protein X [Endozoicomonas gorgoniicola]
MAKYTTVDGDMLDAICFRHYGNLNGTVERVLNANPGLCEQPAVLPAGLVIELPVLESAEAITLIDLFE